MTKVALKISFNTKTHLHTKITSKPFPPFQFLNFSPTQDFNKNSMFENAAFLKRFHGWTRVCKRRGLYTKNKNYAKMDRPVQYRCIDDNKTIVRFGFSRSSYFWHFFFQQILKNIIIFISSLSIPAGTDNHTVVHSVIKHSCRGYATSA